jgi:hypothetical protein
MMGLVATMNTGHAAPAADVPSHIAEAIPNARLSGGGAFRYLGFHVYDAQLWVGNAGYQADAPFAIDLAYARNFDGAEIAKTSRDEMQRMSYGTAAQREQWFGQMQAIFPNVQKGQHITGVFLPKVVSKAIPKETIGEASTAASAGTSGGVKFFLNGTAIGAIMEADFARAFAAIWLDPRTKAGQVRVQMLAGSGKAP